MSALHQLPDDCICHHKMTSGRTEKCGQNPRTCSQLGKTHQTQNPDVQNINRFLLINKQLGQQIKSDDNTKIHARIGEIIQKLIRQTLTNQKPTTDNRKYHLSTPKLK